MDGIRIPAAVLTAATVATLGLGGASPAAGQSWTWASTAETAGDDVSLLYTSVGMAPARLGFRPTFGVSAYRLWTEFDDVWSVQPSVGLEYRSPVGSLEGDVGYAIKNEDGSFPFGGGDRSGVTTGVHAEYWGTGRVGLQGLASYNWGSDYLWSRARGTTRIADFGGGSSLHLGGELVWQGEWQADVAGAEEYQATQVGPVLQWIHPGGFIVAGGAGWKDDNFREDGTGYVKLELVLTP